nr:MAG TPA: hypothetical protein [Caudoviricetes sp.]
MRNWFRTCSLLSPEISISTFYTLGFPIFIRGIDYTINRSGYSLVVVAGPSCALHLELSHRIIQSFTFLPYCND